MKTTKPIRNALIGALLFTSSLLSAQSLTFSAPGGFYEQSFQLTLSCENRDATIHYTTNGNTPTVNDYTYTGSLLLNKELLSQSNIYTIVNCPETEFFLPDSVQKCITIRAAAFNNTGQQIGDIVTNTYLIKSLGCDTHGLPVVSVCADSLDLFDYERGIFVPGKHFVNWNPDYSGNYYQDGRDWERECNLEFYECNNNGINQKAGVRIQGNGSRRFSQKGLKFYARQEYGSKRFKYKFFDDLETDSFKHLKIKPFRSGYEELGCQDYLCSQIARMVQVEHLATRPVILFLNGEYWGIYYLQEKPDERYLEDHFSVDLGQINIIGNWNGLCEYGSNESFWPFSTGLKTTTCPMKKTTRTQPVKLTSLISLIIKSLNYSLPTPIGQQTRCGVGRKTVDLGARFIMMATLALSSPNSASSPTPPMPKKTITI